MKSEAKSASIARDFVRQRLSDHHQSSLVEDVQLVVSELAHMLIDQHHQSEFTVLLLGGGGEVLLQLQDGPLSFAHLVDGRMAKGYDLQLTERLSERWGIDLAHTGGSVMWASFAASDPVMPQPTR